MKPTNTLTCQSFISLICFTLAAGIVPRTFAALVAYEGYDYPANMDLSSGANGGIGWAGAWENMDNSGADVAVGVQTVIAGSLSYTDASGKKVVTTGNRALYSGANGQNCQPGRRMSTRRGADGTTTWLSFLGVRVGAKSGSAGTDGAPTYERGANFTLWDTTLAADANAQRVAIGENSGVPPGGQPNDTWGISARGAGSVRRQSTNAFDQISLAVIRIDHKGDETVPDDLYFWVNPLLGVQPSFASAATNILSSETPPAGYTHDFSFDRVRQFAGNLSGTQAFAEWEFDEFRVGETYADVTPFTPVSSGPLNLSVSRSGNQIEIAWPDGTLESATSITGPWSAEPGAAAPSYKYTPGGAQRYFRARR